MRISDPGPDVYTRAQVTLDAFLGRLAAPAPAPVPLPPPSEPPRPREKKPVRLRGIAVKKAPTVRADQAEFGASTTRRPAERTQRCGTVCRDGGPTLDTFDAQEHPGDDFNAWDGE